MEIKWVQILADLQKLVPQILSKRTLLKHKGGTPEKSVVSNAEQVIIDYCETKFRQCDIVCEETSHTITQDYILIDPIDGTKNFLQNKKEWAISICRVQQGKCTGGIIYYPEMRCHLIYDTSVYFNGNTVVSQQKQLSNLFRRSGNLGGDHGMHTGSLCVTLLYLLAQYTNIPLHGIDYYEGYQTEIWDIGLFAEILPQFMYSNLQSPYTQLVIEQKYIIGHKT